MAGELFKKRGGMANIVSPSALLHGRSPVANIQTQNVKAMFAANNDLDVDNSVVIPDNGHGMVCGIFNYVKGGSGSNIFLPFKAEHTDAGLLVFDYVPFIRQANHGFGAETLEEENIGYPETGAGTTQVPGIIFY